MGKSVTLQCDLSISLAAFPHITNTARGAPRGRAQQWHGGVKVLDVF